MFNSENRDGEVSTYCGQTFKMLDKWLAKVASENDAERASKIVTETFQNNIRANITYYEDLAKGAQEQHREEMAATKQVVASLYKVFLTS